MEKYKVKLIEGNDTEGNVELLVKKWYGWVTVKWWYYNTEDECKRAVKQANQVKRLLETPY